MNILLRLGPPSLIAFLCACSSSTDTAPTTSAYGSTSGGSVGAPIGSACTAQTDCASGLYCSTSDPGGQCLKACSTQSDCPSGSVCTDEKKCYKACSTAADCTRDGYTCVDSAPQKTCDVAPAQDGG